MNDALDWVTGTLATSSDGRPASPSGVLFLLRCYASAGREDARDAVEAQLTDGLAAFAAELDPRARCRWLEVFAEASAISDDDRLPEAVQTGLASAIESLEQVVRAAYEPGEGMPGGSLDDQVRWGLDWLIAFQLTGRLPYSMLAEELLQVSRRRSWDEEAGAFRADFGANCDAARLLCQLAALRRDPEYATSVVAAGEAAYPHDAERTLNWLGTRYRAHRDRSADYGLALLDWFALNQHPN